MQRVVVLKSVPKSLEYVMVLACCFLRSEYMMSSMRREILCLYGLKKGKVSSSFLKTTSSDVKDTLNSSYVILQEKLLFEYAIFHFIVSWKRWNFLGRVWLFPCRPVWRSPLKEVPAIIGEK